LGQTILIASESNVAYQNAIIDVSSLSSGTYILKVYSDNKVYLKKWIKSE